MKNFNHTRRFFGLQISKHCLCLKWPTHIIGTFPSHAFTMILTLLGLQTINITSQITLLASGSCQNYCTKGNLALCWIYQLRKFLKRFLWLYCQKATSSVPKKVGTLEWASPFLADASSMSRANKRPASSALHGPWQN